MTGDKRLVSNTGECQLFLISLSLYAHTLCVLYLSLHISYLNLYVYVCANAQAGNFDLAIRYQKSLKAQMEMEKKRHLETAKANSLTSGRFVYEGLTFVMLV